MRLCFGAGLLSSFWSPLATYQFKHGENHPALSVLIFALGELCALPSVLAILTRLDGKLVPALRDLPVANALWGCACGTLVASGYVGYFTAVDGGISGSVAFGIVGSAALTALVLDAVLGAFAGLPPTIL